MMGSSIILRDVPDAGAMSLHAPRRKMESKKCELCKTCPVYIPSESDDEEGQRKAIYMPSPEAVPSVPTIDRDNCVICGCCDWICKTESTDAIRFSQKPEKIKIEVESIVDCNASTS